MCLVMLIIYRTIYEHDSLHALNHQMRAFPPSPARAPRHPQIIQMFQKQRSVSQVVFPRSQADLAVDREGSCPWCVYDRSQYH